VGTMPIPRMVLPRKLGKHLPLQLNHWWRHLDGQATLICLPYPGILASVVFLPVPALPGSNTTILTERTFLTRNITKY
jgi:hypothetical protein